MNMPNNTKNNKGDFFNNIKRMIGSDDSDFEKLISSDPDLLSDLISAVSKKEVSQLLQKARKKINTQI